MNNHMINLGSIFLLIILGTTTPCLAINLNLSTGNLSFNDGLGHSMPYRLYLPPGYNPNVKYPLITFLHGAGESGTDNAAPSSVHIDTLFGAAQGNLGMQYKSLLLVPQTQWGWQDYGPQYPDYVGQKLALDIIDLITSTYFVDTQRLYVTGLSMGGGGTFNIIANHPDMFAAAAPLSGWGDTSTASIIKDIPIWVFHGVADSVVEVNYSDEMYDAIEAAGGHMEYSRPEGVGHGDWNVFYDGSTYKNSKGETFYQWMFSKSLPVPEPSAIMMCVGGAGIGLFFMRRRPIRLQ
jgi:predicted peptidase